MGLVRERTIPIERPPLFSAKLVPTFADRIYRVVSAADPNGRIFSRPELLLLLPSSSSVVLMRLSAPRSRPSTSQKIGNWTRYLWICSQELWPLDRMLLQLPIIFVNYVAPLLEAILKEGIWWSLNYMLVKVMTHTEHSPSIYYNFGCILD
jgi:hypothetical protein